tara:strand:+ start:79994 stop:80527 length:534 start_codon:yes stop_codon:yes gene_type:complete
MASLSSRYFEIINVILREFSRILSVSAMRTIHIMSTKHAFFSVTHSALLFMLSSFTGCMGSGGEPIPDLAEVTGIVTLDGSPLENAKIVFEPQQISEKGRARASSASTAADGSYTLEYNADASGATPGKHTVVVLKMSDDPAKAGEQLIPAKYNDKTELTADITTGENTVNFDLKSK